MNIIGEQATILKAADPSKNGRKGQVVLETANTVLLSSGTRRFTVEKKGTVFLLDGTARPVIGDDLKGRLEDRLRSKK